MAKGRLRVAGRPQIDPDAAAVPGSGLFGLDTTPKVAGVVVVPVPFEATTSYGGGTSRAPTAILKASHQVDLLDREHGKPYALTEVPVSEADVSMVAEAVGKTSLPVWAEQCNKVNPSCEADWRAQIGPNVGL